MHAENEPHTQRLRKAKPKIDTGLVKTDKNPNNELNNQKASGLITANQESKSVTKKVHSIS